MGQLLRSHQFRRVVVQGTFVFIIVALLVFFAVVGQRNIVTQGIATGFGFLERSTGWPMSFSVVETSPRDSYAWFLFAGLLNTLLVGFMTLFFASCLGLALAFMRLSENLLARFVGTSFVEIFRNVPVILQVVFWYAVLTHLPTPREALSLADMAYLSNRGLMLPAPVMSATDVLIFMAAVLALLFTLWFMPKEARPPRIGQIGGVVLIILLLVLMLLGREPEAPLMSVPELAGLRFVGGFTLKPEFSALLIGLSLFGSAYIGEIIRGGLLSVDKGPLEAGMALGLSTWKINRYIRIPLAFRAMLPSLTNQYIWLMKATTLGIAIGFHDFFAIISTSINQSGQTLELIALLMLGFLLVNYSMGLVLNRLNDRLKLKGRS